MVGTCRGGEGGDGDQKETSLFNIKRGLIKIESSDIELLLTGFPRTVVQAEKLGEKQELDVVVNLDVPFETIIDRISVSSVTNQFYLILL